MSSLSKSSKIVSIAIFTVLTIGIGFLAIQIKDVQTNQENLSKEIKLIQKTLEKNNANLLALITPPPRPTFSKVAYQIKDNDSVILGNPKADVSVTLWTDFQCPYCAQSSAIIASLQKKYSQNVKFIIKHYPLPFHQQAKGATQFALAAHKQNAYLPMYLKIFKNYKKLKQNPNLPIDLAKKLNLNVEQLKKDANSSTIKNQINKEMNELQELGVNKISVPKYFIDNREYFGNRTLEDFSKHIDEALAKTK